MNECMKIDNFPDTFIINIVGWCNVTCPVKPMF